MEGGGELRSPGRLTIGRRLATCPTRRLTGTRREDGMDLQVYYKKIRETAATYAEKDVVIISRATGDGGKAGVYTEVPRGVAAKMVVEGTAEPASAEAAEAFRQARAEEKQRAERELAAAKMPLSVVTAAELQRLMGLRNQD